MLFVRGIMPRSGTNFLADALACHSSVERFPGNFWEFPPFRAQPRLNDYLGCIDHSSHAPEFSAEDFLPHIGRAWTDYLGRDVEPGKRLLFKEPSVDHLDAMFRMFPDCRAVVVVRNGDDLIESLLRAGFGLPPRSIRNPHHWRRFLTDEDFRILCRRLKAAADHLHRFLAGNPSGPLRMIRFEELFADSETVLRDLIDWAGLPPDDVDWQALNTLPVRGSSFLRNPDGQMNFEGGVDRSAAFNPVGRSAEWSAARRAFYQKKVAPALARLNEFYG